MSVGGGSVIAVNCKACLTWFEKLSSLVDDSQQSAFLITHAEVHDQWDRFNIWVGNLGASHSLSLRSSLDYRLRDAPQIKNQIVELLQDLHEALEDASSITSGDRANRTSSPVGTDDGRSQSSKQDLEISEPVSEIQELFGIVSESIANLFRLAVIIRRATPRDRYLKAAAAAHEPFDSSFDIAHVGHKFPRLDTEHSKWLKQRLGNAISHRRQFLRYSREHRDRKARTIKEENTEDDFHLHRAGLVARSMNQQVTGDGKSRVSDLAPPSSLAKTTASTLAPDQLQEAEIMSDTGVSQTSYATSITEDDASQRLRVVQLKDASKGNSLFECPYCWTIQDMKSHHMWKKHVFRDLRPYVCTFRECDLKMFPDRTSWFEHELQEHRIEWSCPICTNRSYRSSKEFENHVLRKHPNHFSNAELPTLSSASRVSLDKIPASSCPFCSEWEDALRTANKHISADETIVVTAQQFRRHVGAHMEQLALFAIPRGYEEEGDADSGQVAAGDSVSASMKSDGLSESSVSSERLSQLHRTIYTGQERVFDDALADALKLVYLLGIDTKSKRWGSTLHVAASGDSELHDAIVRRVLEMEPFVDATNEGGETPLHVAVRSADNGYINVAVLLISCGATVDAQNYSGATPLHLAVANGRSNLVRQLIDAGANINLGDHEGSTALHISASRGLYHMARLLSKFGADLDCSNQLGETPLYGAIRASSSKVVDILLQAGCNFNHKAADGSTPLHYAAGSKDVAFVRTLVEYGADLNALDKEEETPLYTAIRCNRPMAVSMLLAANAAVTHANLAGDSPLHIAVDESLIEIVDILIANRADVNQMNLAGDTPMCRVINQRDSKIIGTLAKAGANINYQYPNGDSILHKAINVRMIAGTDDREVIESLLQNGADPHALDEDDMSPLLLVAAGNDQPMMKLLASYGASYKSWRSSISERYSKLGSVKTLARTIMPHKDSSRAFVNLVNYYRGVERESEAVEIEDYAKAWEIDLDFDKVPELADPLSPKLLAPKNTAKPIVIKEDYMIKCICDHQEDDGGTILCEICNTLQHIECYYAGTSPPAEHETHACIDCEPRSLDHRNAIKRYLANREKGNNDSIMEKLATMIEKTEVEQALKKRDGDDQVDNQTNSAMSRSERLFRSTADPQESQSQDESIVLDPKIVYQHFMRHYGKDKPLFTLEKFDSLSNLGSRPPSNDAASFADHFLDPKSLTVITWQNVLKIIDIHETHQLLHFEHDGSNLRLLGLQAALYQDWCDAEQNHYYQDETKLGIHLLPQRSELPLILQSMFLLAYKLKHQEIPERARDIMDDVLRHSERINDGDRAIKAQESLWKWAGLPSPAYQEGDVVKFSRKNFTGRVRSRRWESTEHQWVYLLYSAGMKDIEYSNEDELTLIRTKYEATREGEEEEEEEPENWGIEEGEEWSEEGEEGEEEEEEEEEEEGGPELAKLDAAGQREEQAKHTSRAEDDLLGREDGASYQTRDFRSTVLPVNPVDEDGLSLSHIPTSHEISKTKKGKLVQMQVCQFCGKVFKKVEHRNRHEARHKVEFPLKCQVKGCEKRFARAHLLARHLERQHNIAREYE